MPRHATLSWHAPDVSSPCMDLLLWSAVTHPCHCHSISSRSYLAALSTGAAVWRQPGSYHPGRICILLHAWLAVCLQRCCMMHGTWSRSAAAASLRTITSHCVVYVVLRPGRALHWSCIPLAQTQCVFVKRSRFTVVQQWVVGQALWHNWPAGRPSSLHCALLLLTPRTHLCCSTADHSVIRDTGRSLATAALAPGQAHGQERTPAIYVF